MNKYVIGGRALFDGINLVTNNCKVSSRRTDEGVQVEGSIINKNIIDFSRIIGRILFIRGLWGIVRIITSSRQLMLLILISLLINYTPLNTLYPQLIIPSEYLVIVLLIIMTLTVHLTELGKYHAVEHMVVHCYEKNKDLTVKNVLTQPRVHRRCGTNYFVIIVLLFFIISAIPIFNNTNATVLFLLSWTIAYEIFHSNINIVEKVFAPIYFIGSFLQRFLFTSKPTEKHAMVAIEAMDKLLTLQEDGK